jgi:hypothetical protein
MCSLAAERRIGCSGAGEDFIRSYTTLYREIVTLVSPHQAQIVGCGVRTHVLLETSHFLFVTAAAW